MADIKTLVQEHLQTARVMQLATAVDNQPWVCSVHFYADADFNIYWFSTPSRRHSVEIEQNPKAAFTIKVHEDTPDERYVIGLSGEGTAELMSNDAIKEIGVEYIAKLTKDPELLDGILLGKNPHRCYRLKVSKFVLFDSKNFADNPRQEFVPQ